ncbi:NGRN protein, partial [Galbula dea]|nr:NGRN protein [Galbula dea]
GLRQFALLLAWTPRRAAWTGDTEPPDPALEEAERCGAVGNWERDCRPGAGVHAFFRRARRQREAARLRRLRRELGEERGAPERTLTWQAMEQMRFLRQELPEEWPLERLAEGFGVSTDVVRRVLRSRGCVPPHRRQRQDERALSARSAPVAGYEVRAPDGTLLYRLPRGRGGPGHSAQ